MISDLVSKSQAFSRGVWSEVKTHTVHVWSDFHVYTQDPL